MTTFASLTSLCLQSARRALQWRLPMLTGVALLLPVLIVAAPAWLLLDAQLSHSVHATMLARQLDLSAITDLLAVGQRHAMALQLALLAALACTALLAPLLTGATMTAARSPTPPALRALLAGGIAEYPRLLRMLLWSGVLMGAALWLGNFLSGLALPAEALLPTDGQIADYAAQAATVVLVWGALVTVDAGRAVLAADRRRTSALRAWWDGIGLLRRQPVAMLGSYALLGLAGFGMAGLLGLGRLHFPVGSLAGDVAALVLTQLIAVLLAWFRAARLFALIAVARP